MGPSDFLPPATPPSHLQTWRPVWRRSALTVAQRVDLIDGHLWGNESQLFEAGCLGELGLRLEAAGGATCGKGRANRRPLGGPWFSSSLGEEEVS